MSNGWVAVPFWNGSFFGGKIIFEVLWTRTAGMEKGKIRFYIERESVYLRGSCFGCFISTKLSKSILCLKTPVSKIGWSFDVVAPLSAGVGIFESKFIRWRNHFNFIPKIATIKHKRAPVEPIDAVVL